MTPPAEQKNFKKLQNPYIYLSVYIYANNDFRNNGEKHGRLPTKV